VTVVGEKAKRIATLLRDSTQIVDSLQSKSLKIVHYYRDKIDRKLLISCGFVEQRSRPFAPTSPQR
jgi:hypothetical protein